MRGEIDVFGLYIPSLALCVGIGYLFFKLVSQKLKGHGFYEKIWHPPLFDLGACVLCVGFVVVLYRIWSRF